ncbi:UDP-N-acetylglucosamine 2-epimerase [Intrasporangium chromatireducens Q5-1]|uniref:UDP-N-acetylglucosamine 2-epimerase n=1 Tax=Intrasporangium chromatireducens Q5-1 TaxID=584657 RepID=W9GN59_9MICO|nr:UDP-N-acetylglucosamine 2-epimerase (non-hydrolyzing) [Intrasporangium chromatireducens]EWT07535.1 UDP-N-acetylglucosamine 2-epimerase [Intrasporangium chromatireducens Q5-1]
MKILTIVGARPEFIQVAPLAWALADGEDQHVIVHTGQHYDRLMSDVFFEDLHVPEPDIFLGVGSGSHGIQTGAILAALDPVLEEEKPDVVVVFGDTNSTLAGALAAVKMHIPVAHIEAGLRSFNRRMPEEVNRILTDHASTVLYAPTDIAMSQLAREGLGERAVKVGDIKTEITFAVRDQVANQSVELPRQIDADGPYYVATIHRAENTDDQERLAGTIEALAAAPHPVALLAHPRLRDRAERAGLRLDQGAIVVCEPLTYPAMIRAVVGSVGVITDSGGLQKEAFLLRRPCITVRTETEWVETVELGWNILCTTPDQLAAALRMPAPPTTDAAPYGTGDTAARIVSDLRKRALS